jgi:2-phosphoglycerate kinase
VILIGGTTGVGKHLATRWRIGWASPVSSAPTRSSGDACLLRATDAGITIRRSPPDAARMPVTGDADLTRAGFVEQTKTVAVGLNAIVRRAVEEAQSTIVEGVHVVPGFLQTVDYRDGLILQFILKVDDADAHRSHFYVREWQTDGIRPLRRYIRSFSQIRSVQKYILARAAQYGVPVFDNVSIDLTVKAVMGEILQAVSAYPIQAAVRVGG